MTTSSDDRQKVEAYARALIEAGRAEGRPNADLVQWLHAGKFSPEVLEALGAMHHAGDLELIDAVSKQYKEIIDNEDDTVNVTVTTAVPLDEELRRKVKTKVEADLGRPIYLVERVEPEILGGIIIEQRGKRFDASVRAQLTSIRRQLSTTFIGVDDNDK